MTSEKRWQRGDVVLLRDPLQTRATRTYEELTGDHTPNIPGWPHVVVEDTDERVALYCPERTPIWRWNILQQEFRVPLHTWGESVRLLLPGKPFTVTCMYETGTGPAPYVLYYYAAGDRAFPGAEVPAYPDFVWDAPPGHFYGWKVDITAPFQRMDAGFDLTDEVLDIVVRPDRNYVWKDDDQMSRLVQRGIYTQQEYDALREAGNEVIDLIERGLPPFDDEWR